MIARLAAILFAVGAGAPLAVAQTFEHPAEFRGEVSMNIDGGYFFMGEDKHITELFRDHRAVAADFQIITPHRTEEFGTGVAFWVFNSEGKEAARIVFRDIEGRDKVEFGVEHHWTDNDREMGALVSRRELTIPKAVVGRVVIQRDGDDQISVRVDGATYAVKPGFKPDRIVVQIFCSYSWVRFLEDDLVS